MLILSACIARVGKEVQEGFTGATVVLRYDDATNRYSLEVSCGTHVVDADVSPFNNNKVQEVDLSSPSFESYRFYVSYNDKGISDFVLLEDSDMTPCKFHEGAGL